MRAQNKNPFVNTVKSKLANGQVFLCLKLGVKACIYIKKRCDHNDGD